MIIIPINSAAASQQIQPRIVNGQPADPQRWPALGALINADKPADRGLLCAATLIAPRWALTAAHCLWDPKVKIDIVFQRPDLRFPTGHRRAAVKTFTRKPSRSRPSGDYGLVYLNRAVTDIKPLRLAGRQRLDGRPLLIAGWGGTKFGRPPVDILRQGKIRVRPDRRCRQAYKSLFISTTMFCAGADRGVDACQGDSGGPATDLSGRVILGIVSWGNGCGQSKYPGVYARVSAAKAWINKIRARGPGAYRQRQPGVDGQYRPILTEQIFALDISVDPRRPRLNFFLPSKEPMSAATVTMPPEANPCPVGAERCPQPGESIPLRRTDNSRLATLAVDVDPGCYWFDWQAQFRDRRFAPQSGRYQLKICR